MKGLTLLELVIAGAIATMVGIVLLGIISNHTGLFYKQSSIVSEGLNLNDALQEISNQIRQASYVASGYPESSPTYTTSADTLVLKVLSYDDIGIISETYDYVVVYKDPASSTLLRMQIFPNPLSSRTADNRVLTTLFKSLIFSYLDQNGNAVTPTSAWQVEANLTVESKMGSVVSERSSSIKTSLRNN